jgi:hypothetical protein
MGADCGNCRHYAQLSDSVPALARRVWALPVHVQWMISNND